MKLLVELQNDEMFEMITEGEGQAKNHYLKGKLLEFDQPNKNKRLYRSELLDESVHKYINEKVKGKNAYGELDHPDGPVVALKNASHRFTEMWKEGSDWHGKSIISNNSVGNIVKGLLETGGALGSSSRGMGALKPMNESNYTEVQKGFNLVTAGDLVTDPSAHNAFVTGIMENVEYFYDETNGIWVAETVTNIKADLKKMTLQQIEEKKIKIFENFMSGLRKI
jgi:hypothetical protein